MKKYDREKKKWVSIEEYEKTHKPRDKKKCRGGKPHDFVLVLPFYTSYDSTYKYHPEDYYKIMDERYEFIEKQRTELEKMGIKDRGWNRKETRLFMCAVCKKQEYE